MIPLERMTRGARVTFGANGAEGEMAQKGGDDGGGGPEVVVGGWEGLISAVKDSTDWKELKEGKVCCQKVRPHPHHPHTHTLMVCKRQMMLVNHWFLGRCLFGIGR